MQLSVSLSCEAMTRGNCGECGECGVQDADRGSKCLPPPDRLLVRQPVLCRYPPLLHLSQHHRTRRATPAAPAPPTSATHQASLTPRRPLPSTLHVYVSLPPRTADRASGNPRTLHSPSIEGTRVTTPVTTLLRPPVSSTSTDAYRWAHCHTGTSAHRHATARYGASHHLRSDHGLIE